MLSTLLKISEGQVSLRAAKNVLVLTICILAATPVRAQEGGNGASKVLMSKPWSIGVFGTGGFASGYKDDQQYFESNAGEVRISAPIELHVFNGGIHVGKILSRPAGPSILRGQFELAAELLPYWQAHYPQQTLTYHFGGGTESGTYDSKNRYGMSATPFLCRWNFSNIGRVVPWAQLGGGLLWTNHKFPQYPDTRANTSVINFTPQFGIGAHIFVKPRQSLFFAVNAVHISNASLGDHNPGVNVTTQFSVGYSWWR